MRMKRMLISSALALICALAWPAMAEVEATTPDHQVETFSLLQIDDLATGTPEVAAAEPERLRSTSDTFSDTAYSADLTGQGARVDRYDKIDA